MEKRDGTSFTDTSDPVVSSSPPSTSGGSGNSTTDKLIGGVSDAPPQNFNASTDGVFGSVSDFSSLPPAFSANLGDNFGKYGDYSNFLPPPNTDTGTFEAASKFSADSAAVAKGSNAPAFTMPDMTKAMAATNASKPLNDNLGGSGNSNTLVANVFPTGVTPGTPPAAGTTGTKADAVGTKVAALDKKTDTPEAKPVDAKKTAEPSKDTTKITTTKSETTITGQRRPDATQGSSKSCSTKCAALAKTLKDNNFIFSFLRENVSRANRVAGASPLTEDQVNAIDSNIKALSDDSCPDVFNINWGQNNQLKSVDIDFKSEGLKNKNLTCFEDLGLEVDKKENGNKAQHSDSKDKKASPIDPKAKVE
jgi:hypothetical protein